MEMVQLLQLSSLAWADALGLDRGEDHRWLSGLLADMIKYSEENQLDEVSGALIEAMEKIAPVLARRNACLKIHARPVSDLTRAELGNIVLLHREPKPDR